MRLRLVSRKTILRLRTVIIHPRQSLIWLGLAGREAALHLLTVFAQALRRIILPRLTSQRTRISLLFPSIAIVASVVLLSPLLLPQGLPFYGDETYWIPWTLATLSTYNLQIWTLGNGPSTGMLSLFPTLLLVGLRGILGQEFGVKGYLLLMAWLSATIPYSATRQLLRHWKLMLDPLKLELASGVGGLVSLLFFSNQATVAGSNSYVWVYSLFPLLAASLVIFLDTGNLRQLLTFGVSSVLASPQPFWPYLVGIVGLIYLVFALVRRTATAGLVKLMKNSLLSVAVGLGFNAFWLVPIVAGYVLQAGGSTFQLYTTQGLITPGDLSFLSFWSLQDILMMGESAHGFFWNHPQNYTLFSVVIPLLALSSVLVYRRNRSVLFAGILLIVGALFTAGVNEPLGFLYYLVASNLPYGAGGILRNPTKFVPIVTFAYGLLLGLAVVAIPPILASKKFFQRIFKRNLVRYLTVLALVFLVLAPITYGTLLDLQGYTWPRYSPTNIPPQYSELNDWLTAQPGDFKVMWIPSGGAYDWKQYAISVFPDLLSSKPTVPFNTIYPAALASTNHTGKLLTFLGVKYVVFHGDSINFPNAQILQDLFDQQNLTAVKSLNSTIAAIDNSLAPLPIDSPGTEFGNSPFHLSSVMLPRGQDNLTMSYTIPQSLRDQGFQGQFWDGFGIAIHGFPAGTVDFSSRLFFSTVAHQQMINATDGYASFDVAASLNYPDTSIDLYGNYYDGSFRSLTPLFFIDRLTLVPDYVVNRYFIFENKGFMGPAFSQNVTVAGYAKVTDLLNDNSSVVSSPSAKVTNLQMSGTELGLTVDASSPFLLVLTEPYDRLWRAYVGNVELKPVPVYGLVNGFLVDQTGVLSVRVDYALQNYFYLGTALSFTSLSLLLLVLVLVWRKERRRTLASTEIPVAVPIPAQNV